MVLIYSWKRFYI